MKPIEMKKRMWIETREQLEWSEFEKLRLKASENKILEFEELWGINGRYEQELVQRQAERRVSLLLEYGKDEIARIRRGRHK